ncbi:MAG: DUF6249 domain-containing protein [Calditrichota bacterium]
MEGIIALFLPIIAIVGSFTVILVIVLAVLNNRRARLEMLHKERMMALEKGLPVPMDYSDSQSRRRPYVSGLIWAGIGIALVIWGSLSGESDMNAWGLIPFFVGVALLVGDWMALKRERKNDNDSAVFPPADASYRGPENPS